MSDRNNEGNDDSVTNDILMDEVHDALTAESDRNHQALHEAIAKANEINRLLKLPLSEPTRRAFELRWEHLATTTLVQLLSWFDLGGTVDFGAPVGPWRAACDERRGHDLARAAKASEIGAPVQAAADPCAAPVHMNGAATEASAPLVATSTDGVAPTSSEDLPTAGEPVAPSAVDGEVAEPAEPVVINGASTASVAEVVDASAEPVIHEGTFHRAPGRRRLAIEVPVQNSAVNAAARSAGGSRRDDGPVDRSDDEPSGQIALTALSKRLARTMTETGPMAEAHMFAEVDHRDEWCAFPRDVQHALMCFCACRLRALQAAGRLSVAVTVRFQRLTALGHRENLGNAHGLRLDDVPQHATWMADAAAWMKYLNAAFPVERPPVESPTRLIEAVEDAVRDMTSATSIEEADAARARSVQATSDALGAGVPARHVRFARAVAPIATALVGPKFRGLRRAARDAMDIASKETPEALEEDLPADWPWWGCTRGCSVALLGGSAREPNRLRIEKTFGFESLEWWETEFKSRGLQMARDRILSNRLDLLLVITNLVGHDASNIVIPACKSSGTHWAFIAQGYGVGQIRASIERYLQP